MGTKRSSCVIVADRHPVMLRALKQVLESEFEVVGMVDNTVSLMDAMDATEPDAVIIELGLGATDATHLLRHLVRRFPRIPVVAIGDAESPAEESEVQDLGAAAYVSKANAATDLVRVVAAVLARQTDDQTTPP